MSDFARILAVHRHDADLHELRQMAAELPGYIAKVEAKIAEAVHQRDSFTAQRDAAIHARRAQERRVEELDGERIRFEKQLQQVKKNEEYTALLKEIADRVKLRDDPNQMLIDWSNLAPATRTRHASVDCRSLAR